MSGSALYRFVEREACRFAWGSAFLMAGLLPGVAVADIPGIQFHGFASQGVISTSANNFFGPSENRLSTQFTELGINGSYRLSPVLMFSGQILSRRAGATDDGRLRLDYGFVDYTIGESDDGKWGVLLGKVKNPYGLYNLTRDMAFTRPSILLPQSIYFDRARNFALAAPGASLYGERRTDMGDLFLQVAASTPTVDDSGTKFAFFGRDLPGTLDGRLSYIARVMIEEGGGRARLAVTGAQVNARYRPAYSDPYADGRLVFSPLILSAQYGAERWTLTGEYGVERVTMSGFGAALPDRASTSEQFYLQGTYRLAEKWELLLRYDVLYLNRDDRDGTRYAAASGAPAYGQFAKDWTVGLRYDPTPSWMLRAELHAVNGTAWLPHEDNPIPAATRARWNMLLFQAAYKF